MTYTIYLRPLQLEDAQTSCKWRNNPAIWKLTGSQPDRYITAEMETAWLADVLQRPSEKRFAVCLKENDQYIGNIHLENIEETEAQYSGLFIGEPLLWGKGIGTQASAILIEYAFETLKVEKLYGFVRKEHGASLRMLQKIGFSTEPHSDEMIRISIEKAVWLSQKENEPVAASK